MRKINKIIIHCSATPQGRDVSVAEIERWHRARGFSQIGYHYIISINGIIQKGRNIELAGAHTQGHNANSIGICYVGGMDAANSKPKDTRTPAQKRALKTLVAELRSLYPGASIHGHNEFANKACPSFNVQNESW
ncbi:MAG: N-acetylmuramoyl-L-alanine amidase [Bacteroidales bacterium]|jgi:N-acetylmuramoyl-L-alanine amidase|nr:N-acetylmuramoyl-L-alanine amidase [Bacteroidales bacterium]HOI31214.1 N-acetylmuramoyl-L-alanine amidase [Bacteroidales bacterium]